MNSSAARDITPSARRLTSSLRDIGYDFASALADVIDNSITAGASTVDVEVVFKGSESYVLIADDGEGMTEAQLIEALRFGTRRDYESGDLGRYGLGLKTASISQCRQVTVYTRRAPVYRKISGRTLDLDHIEGTDRWEVIDPPAEPPIHRALEWLDDGPGTVVFWRNLDRILPDKRPEGGWAKRRLEQLARRSSEYLGMVFHRFIEGASGTHGRLTITVNGEKVRPWNPFAPFEGHREELLPLCFDVAVGDQTGRVDLRRYVLPPRDRFSSPAEFERLSGPGKWNRQQGLYVYRANRLIQYGGWSGIRAADEHTKFARASVEFPTDLDTLFQINVAKMRVSLPAEVRTLLEKPIHELCRRADVVYRRDGDSRRPVPSKSPGSKAAPQPAAEIGATVIAAALDAGEAEAIARIIESVRHLSPETADALGW